LKTKATMVEDQQSSELIPNAPRERISGSDLSAFLKHFKFLELRSYYPNGVQAGYTLMIDPKNRIDPRFLGRLNLRVGDTLLAVNGVALTSVHALDAALDMLAHDFVIQFVFLRDGSLKVLNYEVGP